jgi:hypothetical protein
MLPHAPPTWVSSSPVEQTALAVLLDANEIIQNFSRSRLCWDKALISHCTPWGRFDASFIYMVVVISVS